MIEHDENPEDAAIREMEEETGCRVQLTKIFGTYGGLHFRIRYQNGDEVGCVMTVYEAKIIKGELKADRQEILEVQYFLNEQTKQLNVGNWLPFILEDVYENKLS